MRKNKEYTNSQMAEASYADFEGRDFNDPSDIKAALMNNGFSDAQATDLVAHWKVASHLPNTSTGFSATVFENRQNPGEYVMAIRGTEPGHWYTDIILADIADIGADGIALNQAIDLMNYYQRLTTRIDGNAVQYALYEGPIEPAQGVDYIEYEDGIPFSGTQYRYLVIDGYAQGLGVIPESVSKIDVAGHSLGGHLAMILSRLDPGRIGDVYTYNAPGFDTHLIGSNDTEWFFNAMGQVENLATGVTRVGASFPESILHNYFVHDDYVAKIGTVPGNRIEQFSEGTDPLGWHSIANVADAMAVINLFTKIDSSLDIEMDLTPILLSTTRKENQDISLEVTVTTLAKLFTDPLQVTVGNRDSLYNAIRAVEAELFVDRTVSNPILKTQYQGLSVVDITDHTIESLIASANSDLGYRYALANLNPFAVVGDDSIYTKHNLNHELDLYSKSHREGKITQKYIEDRAAFLYTITQFNYTEASVEGHQLIEFRDLTTGESVEQIATSDHISQRFTFGGIENDIISGGRDDDHLYGGAGDDKLTGLGGADYLEGGSGDDTYIAGDGDTIFDTDGFGRVLFDDIVLIGGVSSGNSNTYQSRDGKATYKLVDHTLTVTGDAGTLTIQNFNNLDLGIVLENAQPAPTIEPIGLMEGNTSTITLNLDQSAGDNGAVYELVVSDPDLLTLSGDGVEVLDAPSGRYRVSVAADASTLTLQANALANDGNNIVNAVTVSVLGVSGTQETDGAPGRILDTVNLIIDDSHYDPSRAQHLYGSDDEDREVGSDVVEDVLTYSYGLGGDDRVLNRGGLTRNYGGDGNDTIYSDYNLSAPKPDMFDGATLDEIAAYLLEKGFAEEPQEAMTLATETRDMRANGDFDDWADGGPGDDALYGSDGEDYLNGGDGKDYLGGGGGDDILIAGDGVENLVTGGAHNDTLVGGSGVDYLLGDANYSPGLTPDSPYYEEWYVTTAPGDQNETILYFHNCVETLGSIVGDQDGADRIFAGAGDDFVLADGGDDYVDGGEGNDCIEGNGGSDSLFGGAGADRIFGDGGEASEYNADGDDYIDGGAGDDYINGAGGSDRIYGGEGDDTIIGGGELKRYQTPDGGDFLFGEAGNDTLEGNEGNDHLDGGIGEDEMSGGTGNDVLLGGAGNDNLFGDEGSDLLYGESGDDWLQGGDGDDILAGGDGKDTLFGEAGRDELHGGDQADEMQGGDDADLLYGDAGDDLLLGQDGDDELYGGTGADQLQGGAGNDILDGGDGVDQLLGGAGDDTLIAGAGNDRLEGGEGNDTYLLALGSGQDVIADTAGVNHLRLGEGIALSEVRSSFVISPQGVLHSMLSYSASDVVFFQPAFVGSESTAVSASGMAVSLSELVQQVAGEFDEGTFTDDTLNGGLSDDRLLGQGGNDKLYGGSGSDWLDGGAGDDLVSGMDGDDALLGGGGNDRLFGGNGDDYLDGGSGVDVLTGGAGNDTYAYTRESGDFIIQEPDDYGGDDDRIVMYDGLTPDEVTPWRSGDDLILSVKGGEDEITIENHFVNDESGIDRVCFSDGTEWDRSYFSDAVLQLGIDHLTGTGGDDTFLVDHTGDTIEELPDSGSDTVISSVRYALPDNVENLTLEGANNVAAIGNDLDNRITGNAGNNVLDGGGVATPGGDVLAGGMGDDTYIVRSSDDVTILEQPDEGTDTLICRDIDGCALPENVENIETALSAALPSAAYVHLVGNDLDNLIKGDMRLGNTLDGGAGADEMWGGRNDDIYILDNPGDVIVEFGGTDKVYINPGYTTDTVYSLADSPVENVWLNDGTTIKEIHGNDSANEISRAEIIYGYGGNDILSATQAAYGGDGSDVLYAPLMYGGDGNDELYGATAYGGKGNDRIYQSSTFHYQLGDGQDWVDDPTHVVLDGEVSMHEIDIKAVQLGTQRRKNLVISFPDGGTITLNGNFMSNAWSAMYSDIEFVLEGRMIHKGEEILAFVRDDKIVGDAEANTIDLTGLSSIAYGLEGEDHISGSGEKGSDNTIVGGAGSDVLVGGAWDGEHYGENWLYGDEGDDVLTAGTGYNHLFGGVGNDRLVAGNGKSNNLFGGEGDDTYVISRDVAAVHIDDTSGENNRIDFGDGIRFDSLGFEELDGSLKISVAGGPETSIVDWKNSQAVNTFVFSDGTQLSAADLVPLSGRLVRLARGSVESYELEMYPQPSTDPQDGDPSVSIRDRWIEIGTGVNQDALTFERSGEDLVIAISGEPEKLTLKYWFHGEDDRYKVPRLVFMDGGEMDLAAIESRVVYRGSDGDDLLQDYRGHNDTILAGAGDDTLNGGVGNDTLYGEVGSDTINGGAGNDLISGGTGNDVLNGGAGDDTFLISVGDGQDVIDTRDGGTDVIKLSAGLTLDRLSFSEDGLDLLIQVDDGSAQSLRVSDYFAGNGGGIDRIVADDGSSVSAADIAALLPGTPPSDDGIIIGHEITGDEADNQLLGTNGNDLIDGAGGADTLFGFAGDDRLLGGEGDDYLSGGNGSNDPNDGNDHLIGGIGNDTLFGEGGNDLMEGGLGDDHYYYKAGGGQDSIDASGGGMDGLFFRDVARDRLSFHQDGNDLVIRVDDDANQQVRVLEHFADAAHAIAYVQPNGGYSISSSEIASLLTPMTTGGDSGGDTGGDPTPPDTPGDGSTPIEVPDSSRYDRVIIGSSVGEQLVGGSGGDYLDALAGDDQLFGLSGNDVLLGGDGADYLDGGTGDDMQFGGVGNDQLGGDAGNDALRGGLGDDIYVYRPGSGADRIDNSDGGVDWLIFTDDLTADRLSYWRSGDDLIARVDDDAAQQVTVQGWYTGNPLSYIQPAGGYGISASQIESMVSDLATAGKSVAMAGSDLSAQMAMLGVMSDAIGRIASGWMGSGRTVQVKPVGDPSSLAGAEETGIKADDVSINRSDTPNVITPPARIERVPDVDILSTDICVKPIASSEKPSGMPSRIFESNAGMADLRIEQLIQSIASFGKPGAHDLLFSRHEDRADEVTLSVSSMN
jgi:Ca2+-binding RTX toxin-like protein